MDDALLMRFVNRGTNLLENVDRPTKAAAGSLQRARR